MGDRIVDDCNRVNSDVNWLLMIQLAVETEWDLIKLSSDNDKLLTLYSVVDVVLVGVVSIDVDSLVLSRVIVTDSLLIQIII